MVRYLFLALLATAACAGSQVQKMPWPTIPPPDPIEPIDASAASQGGPLTAEPVVTTIVVPHEAGPELAPESQRDEPRNLLLHWPLPATGVNSLYGKRRDPVSGSTRTHNGVDLEAEYGAIVSCAAAGLVIYAGWNHGHGRMVVVEHAGGY
ncbi:MAG: M23 family metallopeptidase, partial [Myxococcota bacterium]